MRRRRASACAARHAYDFRPTAHLLLRLLTLCRWCILCNTGGRQAGAVRSDGFHTQQLRIGSESHDPALLSGVSGRLISGYTPSDRRRAGFRPKTRSGCNWNRNRRRGRFTTVHPMSEGTRCSLQSKCVYGRIVAVSDQQKQKGAEGDNRSAFGLAAWDCSLRVCWRARV